MTIKKSERFDTLAVLPSGSSKLCNSADLPKGATAVRHSGPGEYFAMVDGKAWLFRALLKKDEEGKPVLDKEGCTSTVDEPVTNFGDLSPAEGAGDVGGRVKGRRVNGEGNTGGKDSNRVFAN